MAANLQTAFSNVIFLNENDRISIKVSLKFVSKGPIDNIPAMIQIMAWHRTGDNPLPEPMLTQFPDAYMRNDPAVNWPMCLQQTKDCECFVSEFPARKYSSKDNNRNFCVHNNRNFCVNAGMALVLLRWSRSKFRPDSISYFEMF